MLDQAPKRKMTADEFIAWAMSQPGRYELAGGEVVSMAPERAGHAEAKALVARRLAEAVDAAGLRCQVFGDGMAVRIDQDTVYEPDAQVRCGKPLPFDAVELSDPLILVEVISPSSASQDAGAKFAAYFSLQSVRHYLIMDAKRRVVVHHARDASGAIASRIVGPHEPIALDPPGIVIKDLFRPEWD